MQIKSFRVQRYRSIEDSHEVELLDPLTCIVGKNQSGKTALLKALHKFNPFEPDPYVLNREWPRGKRQERDPKQVVCEVRFALSDEDRGALSEITAAEMTAREVVVTKDYSGQFEVVFPETPDLFPAALHPHAIDAICRDFPSWPQPVGDQFLELATECIEETRRLSKEGRFGDLLAAAQKRHVETLNGALSPQSPHQQHEQQFIQAYSQKLEQIRTGLSQERTMQERAHEYVVGRLPKFIYMDDYQAFRGTADLAELQQREKKKALNAEDRTVLMILSLAALKLSDLVEQGNSADPKVVEERQFDLQDGANTLTNRVAKRWGQNPYRIEFRADGQRFFTEIQEEQKDIGMIPLEEQSKGFQWFFSFDLRFMHDSGGTFKNCVLLLDEPGLHLHPGGQDDLLKRLDAYAEGNTLIYTTHLPFLVDLREPKRIKVITQTPNGAVVSDDLGASQPEEKLTLQAALGMRAHQSYLVAARNLTVEGPDDYWLISEISRLFERSERPCLPDDLMITACGGASQVVHWSTFMVGQGLQVVALFDSDAEGEANEAKLRKSWLTRYKPVKSASVLIGSAAGLGTGNRTIEDIFPESFYLDRARAAHEGKLLGSGKSRADLTLKGSGPILPRVVQAAQDLGIDFNKGSVAKIIRGEIARMKNASELPKETQERADRLFKTLSDLLQTSA